jgi:hypothetical protein
VTVVGSSILKRGPRSHVDHHVHRGHQ